MAAPIVVEIEGLDACLRAFNSLDRDLRKQASGELRQASKQIGNDVVIPLLGGSGSPQEHAIIAAAGPKSDRYVVVAVPQRKPKLSGLRKTPAAQAKRLGFALEGGSDYPPFGKPAEGSLVRRHTDEMARRAVPRYLRALETIMRRHGLI